MPSGSPFGKLQKLRLIKLVSVQMALVEVWKVHVYYLCNSPPVRLAILQKLLENLQCFYKSKAHNFSVNKCTGRVYNDASF